MAKTEKPKLTPEEISAKNRAAIMARWKDKTRVTPATLELVREACADGATVGNICAVLGISDWQFRAWRDKYPEFAEAVKAGRMIEHDRLVNKLVSMALDGNVACLIYCLKARHGMMDNQVNQVIENRVAITFSLPDALAPADYLKTLAATAEVIAPGDAARALAKPGIKGKVLKQLSMERSKETQDGCQE
jgi:hypothetical protein